VKRRTPRRKEVPDIAEIEIGSTVDGTVERITPYGAFLKLEDGRLGLVHISEIDRNYVKDVSRRELMEAAIHGVLNKLDPYSNYISPEDIGRFKTSVENQFGGIGIQIGMENGLLKVISPLIGTPAYRAGLESGDLILEIEGKPTDGIQIDEAVKRLKGEAGTKVTLTVRHLGSPTKETLTITRELVHVETVLSDRRKADDSWDFIEQLVL